MIWDGSTWRFHGHCRARALEYIENDTMTWERELSWKRLPPGATFLPISIMAFGSAWTRA